MLDKSSKAYISNAKLIRIGLLANAFEWYEFSIFAFLTIVIGKVFFPPNLPIIQALQVFVFFAISYFIRPLGSIFFGMMGDKKGRRYSLRLSLILIAIPTALIGFLPSYNSIGVVAPFLLFILRLIQGFAMGGELPATACYIYEASHPKARSLLCSAVGAAPKIGLLLGSLVVYLLTQMLDVDSLVKWGWRIPFWLSIPLTLFINYTRNSITETNTFIELTSSQLTARKNNVLPGLNTLIKGCGLCLFLNVGYPILTLWMPFYLNQFLHYPLEIAQLVNTLTLPGIVFFCLVTGYLSKFIGYKKLFIISIIATLFLIIPIFKGLQYAPSFSALLGLQLIFALLVSIGQGVFFELVNDLFDSHHRNLGVSLVTIIPAAIIAGTIPLACSYVVHKTGWLLFPAFYIILSGLIALPAAFKLPSHNTTR